MSIRQTQNIVTGWHTDTFPGAPNAAVALKLGEEVGECLKAVNRLEHHLFTSDTERVRADANLQEEIGDAAICLMVLCSRYGLDLEAVVDARAQVVINRPLPKGSI